LGFKPTFDNQSQRTIVFNSKTQKELVTHSSPIKYGRSAQNDDGMSVFAAITVSGKLEIQTITKEENFLGEVEESKTKYLAPSESKFSHVAINESGNRLFTITEDGILEFWDIKTKKLISRGHLRFDLAERQITALTSMLGVDEAAIAFDNGDLQVAALASVDGGYLQPVIIHDVKVSDSKIEKLVSSPRNRTLFVVNEENEIIAWYSTNHRTLMQTKLEQKVDSLSISSRGHGISLLQDGNMTMWHWDSPHPEAGFKAFFGEIWYAGYDKPSYTWQSSSGSNDFESKISLVPLIYGSIKGAIYAMLFSVPLSVFAALYTSVFAGARVRSIIKPIIEMMSAIPSVVVGFLGALWLAPIVDGHLLDMVVAFPLGILILALLPIVMGQVKGRDLMMLKPGVVLIVSGMGLILSFVIGMPISSAIESSLFDGDFRNWLIEFLGGSYDMRNSIIIGITLGFAVIPIIYTISEDSISSVPKGLLSASLALGATPWQTAWRVVLPAASPGIFAAVTLGLGRAVGETMIVLMATGNTPIMNVNIFEGFRALSANIAVEMPEAPVGGTLYRTLFLSAGVLLIFTSVLNTITEMVRHRLSKTYSKL
jgi:phosphate transport system permease protein